MKLKSILLIVFIYFSQFSIAQGKIVKTNTIKVLTFNILHGATLKGDFDLDLLSKIIIDSKADLVALQEVAFKTNRARGLDLTTELAWRTKMTSVFGKAIKFSGGEYGCAVLSKHSFSKTERYSLPSSKGKEARVAIKTICELPSGQSIAFIATHLDSGNDNTDRNKQAKFLNKLQRSTKIPTILAGDLNALPNSEPMKILDKKWMNIYNSNKLEATYPSENPTKKIDHILVDRKNKWKIIDTQVIENKIASDHCAYLVTIELHY